MNTTVPLLLALLLSGCGSSPTHFYTLTTVPAADLPAGAPCAARPVGVQHVLLPGVLDREAVVRAKTAESLEISGHDRWAAPLDGMIQRIVAQDLRQDVRPNRILLPGDAPPSGGADGLTVNIQRFVGDASGLVSLQADWTLTGSSGSVLKNGSEAITAHAASPATPDVVAAMSQALGELATRIAVALRNCPGSRGRQ